MKAPEAARVRELQRDTGAEREREREHAQETRDHGRAARERECEGDEPCRTARL